MPNRKKIAAIVTTCYPRSHADVIVTKFLKGFPCDDGLHAPQVDIVSMYLDQIHENDVGVELARVHDFPIFPSIPGALTLGGKDLAVDGVLIIGEHGDYAWNEKEQHMYPRRFFFEQVCGVFATSGKSVPVFSDKHLAYNWDNARLMYDRALELSVPFMAGSSLPLAWRNPWLEYEVGIPIQEAVSVAYGGLDSYGFHALELLQCMVERRAGGETGISAVQCLEGAAVWQARQDGLWSSDLFESAIERIEDRRSDTAEDACQNPAVFLIEFANGLKTATFVLRGFLKGWGFSGRTDGGVQATEVFLGNDPYPHFSYLGLNIQEMFLTGLPQYPVERTLLVSGALDALMDSRYQGHSRIETPHLDVSYQPAEQSSIRPSGPRPAGASLVPIVPGRN